MAIYHTRIKTYSRAKEHSAIAAAAYRGGYLLTDHKSDGRHDYRGRAGIIQSRCMAPPGSPPWADDLQALWAAAEAAERRLNSTVCGNRGQSALLPGHHRLAAWTSPPAH